MKELGEILCLWERAKSAGEEAVLATVVPAWRAAVVDPMVALREE